MSLIMSSLALLAVLAIACSAAPTPSVATIIPGSAPLPVGSTPAITIIWRDVVEIDVGHTHTVEVDYDAFCGAWVLPVEVELALNKHPDVKECTVIPTRDAAGLMTSKACILVHDTYAVSAGLAKELQDFVKGQIAPYKYPRLVEFVADLPKTGTDKIDRLALRARESAAEPPAP